MAYEFLEQCNKKNLKARGDYGVRVARPGFDAMNCADNQLIFNSGWPILQLCKVVDTDDGTEYKRYYEVSTDTWYDELPEGYSFFYDDDTPDNRFGVSKRYVRKLLSVKVYANESYDECYEYTYNRIKHDLGYVPFFIPAENVYNTQSNKVLLFSIDIETDVDYPYTDMPLPMVSTPGDYGMKSESVFGPRVPGLSTGQFSQLVQAVKTQDTAKYYYPSGEDTGQGKKCVWAPESDYEDRLFDYAAFGFVVAPVYYNAYDPDEDYYLNESRSVVYTSTIEYASSQTDTDTARAYMICLNSINKKASLVVLRSPLVSSEYSEVTV